MITKQAVSGNRSSEIHVFDTNHEQFVTKYPSSIKGAEVRQIIGRMNEVWLPESALDRLMLIRPGSTGLY